MNIVEQNSCLGNFDFKPKGSLCFESIGRVNAFDLFNIKSIPSYLFNEPQVNGLLPLRRNLSGQKSILNC